MITDSGGNISCSDSTKFATTYLFHRFCNTVCNATLFDIIISGLKLSEVASVMSLLYDMKTILCHVMGTRGNML